VGRRCTLARRHSTQGPEAERRWRQVNVRLLPGGQGHIMKKLALRGHAPGRAPRLLWRRHCAGRRAPPPRAGGPPVTAPAAGTFVDRRRPPVRRPRRSKRSGIGVLVLLCVSALGAVEYLRRSPSPPRLRSCISPRRSRRYSPRRPPPRMRSGAARGEGSIQPAGAGGGIPPRDQRQHRCAALSMGHRR